MLKHNAITSLALEVLRPCPAICFGFQDEFGIMQYQRLAWSQITCRSIPA